MNFIQVAHAGIITEATPIATIGTRILYFLLSVFGIVAIIALAVAGILYFVSSGDEKKMELAKDIVKYVVVGVILAMSAMILVRFIGQFFSGQ